MDKIDSKDIQCSYVGSENGWTKETARTYSVDTLAQKMDGQKRQQGHVMFICWIRKWMDKIDS